MQDLSSKLYFCGHKTRFAHKSYLPTALQRSYKSQFAKRKERRKTSFHFNLQEHNASSINLVRSHIFIDDCSTVIMDLPYNKYWILLPKLLWCFKTLYRNIKNTPVINDLEQIT